MKRTALGLALALVTLLIIGCAQAPPPSAPAAPGSGAPASSRPAEQPAPGSADWDRYVIRTADLRLVVADVEAASDAVARLATAVGGYVAQSNTRHERTRIVADISIHIPADSFDRVVSDLRDLAITVEAVRTYTEDVTEEFVDNEARLRNLRATEDSTLRLMERTTKMEDVLAVQRELTRIRGEIEQIQGRQNYLQRRVQMSTIGVHLTTQPSAALAGARSSWQPLNTALVAWETSLNFLVGAFDVFIALVVLLTVALLWWAIPLFLFLRLLWRRRSRGRRQAPPVQPPPLQTQGTT